MAKTEIGARYFHRWAALSLGYLLLLHPALAQQYGSGDPDANFDRMDGTGASGKKVDVIEWEGNLEIHVAPKGSLTGLGLKIDQPSQGKKVMVISYRFDNTPKPLIRRAILGIELHEGFKAYRDPAEPDYDKIIISNNGLSDGVVAYRLDPPPTQLYPDGVTQEMVAASSSGSPNALANSGAPPAKRAGRQPASDGVIRVEPQPADVDQDGTIRPFFMNH